MVRTQVYLTEYERLGLVDLATMSGKKQSELIREAIDNLIAKFGKVKHKSAIDNAAGLWKDRDELPDFSGMRESWDRS